MSDINTKPEGQPPSEIVGIAARPHLVAAAEAGAVGVRAVEALAAAGYDVVQRVRPEADAMERAERLRDCNRAELPLLQRWQVNQVARALTEYGDRRARAAERQACVAHRVEPTETLPDGSRFRQQDV